MCSKIARKITGSTLGKFGRKYMDPLSRKLADSVDGAVAPGPDGGMNAQQQADAIAAQADAVANAERVAVRRRRRLGSLSAPGRGAVGSPGGRGAAGSALSSGGVSSGTALGFSVPSFSF